MLLPLPIFHDFGNEHQGYQWLTHPRIDCRHSASGVHDDAAAAFTAPSAHARLCLRLARSPP